MAFEVVEIDAAEACFAFGVDFVEAGEDVEDHGAERGGVAIESPGGQIRQRFFELAERVSFVRGTLLRLIWQEMRQNGGDMVFGGCDTLATIRAVRARCIRLYGVRPAGQLSTRRRRSPPSWPADGGARVRHGAHFVDGFAGGADGIVGLSEIAGECGGMQGFDEFERVSTRDGL